MNAKEIILDKVARDEVVFIGSSEDDILGKMKSTLGLIPDHFSIYRHPLSKPGVILRCVDDWNPDLEDNEDARHFLRKKTSALVSDSLPDLIEIFNSNRNDFSDIVAHVMRDHHGYICLNNAHESNHDEVIRAVCELVDDYGCYDSCYDSDGDSIKSTFEYISMLIEEEKYTYFFTHADNSFDASTIFGVLTRFGRFANNVPFDRDIVLPIWLLEPKLMESKELRREFEASFDNLF